MTSMRRQISVTVAPSTTPPGMCSIIYDDGERVTVITAGTEWCEKLADRIRAVADEVRRSNIADSIKAAGAA